MRARLVSEVDRDSDMRLSAEEWQEGAPNFMSRWGWTVKATSKIESKTKDFDVMTVI